MKLQITILTIIISITILSLYADDFMLGAYLYNKNYDTDPSHHITQSNAMSAAGFNTALCSAQDVKTSTSVTNMLSYMHNAHINGILEDFIFDPPTNTYGARTLSSGNYFRFEAEYHDDSSVSRFDLAEPDKYFYMSSDATRVGVHNQQRDTHFSNEYYWQVDNGQAGFAYRDLTNKWPQSNNLTQYRRIGNQFRFANSRMGGYDLFNNNVLYVTYAMYIEDIAAVPANTVIAKISLTSKALDTNNTDNTAIIPHDFGTNASCDTTFVTKEMYLNSPHDPAPALDRNHLITISVPLPRMQTLGLLEDSNISKTINKGLVPNLYWYGYGTLRLDYIDFQDKLYKDYTNQDNVLSQIRTFNLPYLYGYDEPVQGQFASFARISHYWENNSINTQLIAALYEPYNIVKMNTPNHDRYRHRKAFIDTVKPKSYVIDEYPFRKARVPDWTNTSSESFVQNYISELCNEYNFYKTQYLSEHKDFIAVPQTFGSWHAADSTITDDTSYWYFLYPPAKVMKSLQFIPLCYQPKAILDFWFEGSTTYPGIVVSEGGAYTYPSQYDAIVDANNKIKIYGPLVNSVGFEWLGADSVMTVSPSFDVSSVLLDSLYVPLISGSSRYQGWIQAGFYKKDNVHPYLMLVNRRANYLSTRANPNSTSPISSTPLETYNNCYIDELPQTLRLFPNAEAHSQIGTHIGFFDPYDSALYKQNGIYVDINLGPGDGKLLQMVATLPDTVSSNSSISGFGYLQGNKVITNHANVNININAQVTMLSNTTITINTGSTLTIAGHLTGGVNTSIINNGGTLILTGTSILDNINLGGEINISNNSSATITSSSAVTLNPQSHINIDLGSTLTINGVINLGDYSGIINNGGNLFMDSPNQTCVMGQNSRIVVKSSDMSGENGTLHIANTTFDIPTTGVTVWGGIQAESALNVTIDNCEIKHALAGVNSKDSNLYLSNNLFDIPHLQQNGLPYRSAGVFVLNYLRAVDTIITNNNPDHQFAGDDSVPTVFSRAIGIYIEGRNQTLRLQGYTFQNLYDGIHIENSFNLPDSISGCTFTNCVNGIYLNTAYFSGKIVDCSFSQINNPNEMVGINLTITAPIIKDCEFNNLKGSGIRTVQSVYIGREGITNCTFNNCKTGIESLYSTNRIIDSEFNFSKVGLLCHAGSNLDLKSWANNVFNCDSSNVVFTDSTPYKAYLQLEKGHNDFYHPMNPYTDKQAHDFMFDDNYFQDQLFTAIKADYNWFEENKLIVKPPEMSDYVHVINFDPIPNMLPALNNDNRFYLALQYEAEQDYATAYSLYKDILNEPLSEEKEYLGSCVDGMYRIALYKEYPVTENINYFDEKTLQYAISDPYLCKLLNSYLIKEFIVGKEFQSAIDLIQPRIDNPYNAIDSLRAVLDLEIILQLATFEQSKRQVSTTYSQYKYPDSFTFAQKHEEHWNQMISMLENQQDYEEIPPLPSIATLYQNYPNPFNPSTTISFAIPKDTSVKVRLFNIKGQMVKELCNKDMRKGRYKFVWDGKNEQGKGAGSGIYLIRLETKDRVITQKAMMLK